MPELLAQTSPLKPSLSPFYIPPSAPLQPGQSGQDIKDYLEELLHKIPSYIREHNITPDNPEIVARISELNKEFGITWFPEQLQGILDKYGLTVQVF